MLKADLIVKIKEYLDVMQSNTKLIGSSMINIINHKISIVKQWCTPRELSPEEHATWVSAGSPSLLFYTSKDRRIKDMGRGPVPWDEPYERRNYPHNY